MLTFSHSELKALLANAEEQWPNGVRTTYGQENPKPGFWLVGDQGVYLMHNGTSKNADEKPLVVYAEECNPETLDFEDWWDAKNRYFGGDDGVEFIEAPLVKKVATSPGAVLKIRCTPDEIEIIAETLTKPRAKQ